MTGQGGLASVARFSGFGVALLGLTVALAVDFATGVATAAWSAPQTVVPTTDPVHSVDVAVGSFGQAAITWISGTPKAGPERSDGGSSAAQEQVLVSLRQAGASEFDQPATIGNRGSSSPEVGMAADGLTVVTWRDRRGRIMARAGSPTSGWKAARPVSPGGQPGENGVLPPGRRANGPDLAVASNGLAIVAWEGGSHRRKMYAAVRRPGRGWSQPRLLARAESTYGSVTDAAPRHGAVLGSGVWPLDSPSQRTPAQVAVLRGGSAFSKPQKIANSKCPDAGIEVAASPLGEVVAVINGDIDARTVRASLGLRGRRFERAKVISDSSVNSDYAQIGVSDHGRMVATWKLLRSGGDPGGIAAALRHPGGEFSNPVRISDGDDGGLLAMDVGPNGDGVAVWQDLFGGFSLTASFAPSGSVFGPPQAATPPLPTDALAEPAVAVGPAGLATLAWSGPTSGPTGQGIQVVSRLP